MEEKKVVRRTPFVLQLHESEHQAGRHYDLRIKYMHKNKLISFAIPKAKIPQNVGEKVLAVNTPDHTIDWLNYSGRIGSGYGQGNISIVQKGELDIVGWSESQITFYASGKELNGKYSLVRIRIVQNQPGWLLVKARDE